MQLVQNILCMNEDEITLLISKNATWLTSSIYWLERRLQFLLDLGMTLEEAYCCVYRHPQILSYSLDSMQERVNFLQKLGFTKFDTIKLIRGIPQIISLDI